MQTTTWIRNLLLVGALWVPACTIHSTEEPDDDSSEADASSTDTDDSSESDDPSETDPGGPDTDDPSGTDTDGTGTDESSEGDESSENDAGGTDDASTDDGSDSDEGSSETDPLTSDEDSDDEGPDAGANGDETDEPEPTDEADEPTDEADETDEPTDETDAPGVVEPPPSGALDDEARGSIGTLLLQVTAAQAQATPGQRVLYSITVGNRSNAPVEGVNVLFRVPDGHSFNNANDAHPNSSNCGGNATCSPGEEASWNLGSLAAGSTQTIFVNPQVLDTVTAGNAIDTFVRVSATGVNPISVVKTVPVIANPILELALGAGADAVAPGQSIEFELDLGHVGDTTLTGGELQLELPGELSVTAISDGGSEIDDGRIVWPVGNLPMGATLRRTVTATVSASAIPGDVLNPRASLSHDGGQSSVAQLPLSVIAEPHPLSLTITSTPSPAVPGGLVLHQATITNSSVRAIEGINLVMRVPRGLSFNNTIGADPDSSNCAGNATCSADEEASWTIASLPAGTSESIFINPTVVETVVEDGMLISASFALRAAGFNPINVFESFPVVVGSQAQLTLDTLVDPVVPGQSFTYYVHVGQVGTVALGNARLELALPALSSVEAISDGGTQAASGKVVWNLGTVPVAGTVRHSVTVKVAENATAASVLGSRAELRYDGGEEVDAAAEHALSVVGVALPLSVTFDALPDESAAVNSRILYTTTITNNLSRAVDGVSLLLRVPTGLSYNRTTHADPDSSNCGGNATCSAGEEGAWTLGTLTSGETRIVTVNPLVEPSSIGGSLVTVVQRLKASNLGGTIILRKTVPTRD